MPNCCRKTFVRAGAMLQRCFMYWCDISFNVSFDVSFNVSFEASCSVPFKVWFNVSLHVSFNVSFHASCCVFCNVSFNVCLNVSFDGFVQTHASLLNSLTVRTAEFNVPKDVQELISIPTSTLTFEFLDPVECLIRLLTVGPLSAGNPNLNTLLIPYAPFRETLSFTAYPAVNIHIVF